MSARHEMTDAQIMGLLYIVEVRMVEKTSGDIVKHKLLMVGSEMHDIDRKVRWIFDVSNYSEFSVVSAEKIREKVHFLSSTVTQISAPTGNTISRDEGTVQVAEVPLQIEKYDPNLYAVGVVTTMLAKDAEHAIRKVGNALIARGLPGKSHNAPKLSDDSKVTIEQVPKSSGYASARDVSREINRAHFVRG